MTYNLILTSFIFDSEDGEINVIYKDFTKAIDGVDHNLLINTLDLQSNGNILLNWLHSYLSNKISLCFCPWFIYIYLYSFIQYTIRHCTLPYPIHPFCQFYLFCSSSCQIFHIPWLFLWNCFYTLIPFPTVYFFRSTLIIWLLRVSPSVSLWAFLNVLYFPFLVHAPWLVFLTLLITFLLNHHIFYP